jgi:DNA gyrase inhibitor GyrI
MADLPVRIERLPSMTVAAVQAFGASPELDAWSRLREWAEPRGFLADPDCHAVFGFNNPTPLPDQPHYGYEMWMRVDPDTEAGGDVVVKRIPGGRYVVARCKLDHDPRGSVSDVWMSLYEWVQESGSHRWRRTHELERHLGPPDGDTLELELYLPVED